MPIFVTVLLIAHRHKPIDHNSYQGCENLIIKQECVCGKRVVLAM
jgi:hypothetical protein